MSASVHSGHIRKYSLKLNSERVRNASLVAVSWAQAIERGSALSPPPGQSYESSGTLLSSQSSSGAFVGQRLCALAATSRVQGFAAQHDPARSESGPGVCLFHRIRPRVTNRER